MNSPVILRKKVREALAMAPRRAFSERMIFDFVALQVPEPLETEELKAAIQWNHAQFYIESRFNVDDSRDEWRLTDAGKQHEGL